MLITATVTAVAMEASVRLCLNPIIIPDVVRQSITYANNAFSLGIQDLRCAEVNRGRSPVGGFKGSMKDLRKQPSPSIRSQSDHVPSLAHPRLVVGMRVWLYQHRRRIDLLVCTVF